MDERLPSVITQSEAPLVKAADVFRRAAELLDERGWCQGLYERSDGSMCVIGACYNAANELTARHGGVSLFEDFEDSPMFDSLRAHVGGPVHYWNDQPAQTKEGVQALLIRVADESGAMEVEW